MGLAAVGHFLFSRAAFHQLLSCRAIPFFGKLRACALTRLMTELVANVVNHICEPIQGSNAALKQINGAEVDQWVTDQLSAGLFANASLFKDDPTATVALSIP